VEGKNVRVGELGSDLYFAQKAIDTD